MNPTPAILLNNPASKARRLAWFGSPVLVGALAVGGWYGWKSHTAGSDAVAASLANSTFYTVTPMELDVKINKDGELAAINNIDVSCHVEGLNTITYVIPEGTNVKQGDVLVTLDSSNIKHKVEDLKVALENAQANLVTAQQMEEIQKSQNAANLEAADLAVDLAKLDLEAYQKGTFPQAQADAETTLKAAEQTLANKQDDLNNTMALFAKSFVTPSDVKKAELEVTNAANLRDKAKTALEVLMKYQHKKDQTTFESAVAQALQKRERTRAENAANLTQKQAVTRAANTQVRLLTEQYNDQREQLENCTIKAPAPGFVIYASSLDRGMSTQIQEGATVRDKQLLIRLPDTSGMKAVVRIPEAQRSRIRVDDKNPMRAIVRLVRAGKPIELSAWVSRISPISDNSQRWYNPDLKEYPVDLTLDSAPADAKPSESCKAEIFCEHLGGAIAVPLDTIYSAGNDNYVFARFTDEIRPVKVVIGQSTDTHAEVRTGLAAGQDVLRLQVGQGRMLLERAGIKVAPTTRPSGKLAGKKNAPGAPKIPTDPNKLPAGPKAAEAKPADKPKDIKPVSAEASLSPHP